MRLTRQNPIPRPVMAAPMAGYTDPPYRELLKDFGSTLLFTEMIDSHALRARTPRTFEMLGARDSDLYTQIAAGTVELAIEAVTVLGDYDTAGFNINMGCPAKKVVGCGGGSNLLREPKLIQEIVKAVRARIGEAPLSVKFRSGWDCQSLNYLEIGRILEGEGVDFVMLHARTRSEHFSGSAHWDHIRELKKALKIPVIGNGDIVSYESAKRMADETGCDGIAIGRGAIGNPWLYRQAERALAGLAPLPEPSPEERKTLIVKHFSLIQAHYNEQMSVHVFRKHLVGYMKGLPNHKAFKEKVFLEDCLTPVRLDEMLSEYLETEQLLSHPSCTSGAEPAISAVA